MSFVPVCLQAGPFMPVSEKLPIEEIPQHPKFYLLYKVIANT